MSTSYEAAKRVALGLEREQRAQPGDDLWNISLGGGFGLAAEMPFQFFEKGFEPPDELTAQRAALMVLYEEEYAVDRKAAEGRLGALREALAASDLPGLQKVLEEPLEQWLSLIFLEGAPLREELLPKLEGASESCRSAFAAAADRALAQLVDFKELLETLKKHC